MTGTITIKLSNAAIEAVRRNSDLKNRLQMELRISYPTIQRWLKTNNPFLTTAQALKIISEETGLNRSEMLIEE